MHLRLLALLSILIISFSAQAEFVVVDQVEAKTKENSPLFVYNAGGDKVKQTEPLCTLLPGQSIVVVGKGSYFGENAYVARVPEYLGKFGCPSLAVVSAKTVVGGPSFEKEKSNEVVLIPMISQKTEGQNPSGICEECSRGQGIMGKIDLSAIKGTGSDDRTELTRMFPGYSESPTVARVIALAMKRKRPESTGKCFKFVKEAAEGSGLIDYYLGGEFAREAGYHLKRAGFTNLMEDKRLKSLIKKPEDAPKGALLVYSGDEGHIEYKTDYGSLGGYVSDYYSDEPRTGRSLQARGRKLIGVYIKKDI